MPNEPLSSSPPGRRNQAERRSATRSSLLKATMSCLSGLGYSSTTTVAVCKRAGVSQGALFDHFSTKTKLMLATTTHIFAGLIKDFDLALSGVPENDDRASAIVTILWQIFQTPLIDAAFEIYVAARCDHELAEAVAPLAQKHRESMARRAEELFPSAARNDDNFIAIIDVVINTLQGAALSAHAVADTDRPDNLLRFLTTLIQQVAEASENSPKETN